MMALNMINEESAGQVGKIVLLIAVLIFFIFLITMDAVKALRSRAHWIPGDYLVLSALSIQLLNLLSDQGVASDAKPQVNILWNEFWMIHTSRIMMCVVVAYLMPGMANPGSEDFWGKLMALVLTIFLHLTSELYIVHRRQFYPYLWFPEKEVSEPLYIAFAALISLSFVMLILLLGCANIAGRGIERIVAQKIPLILKGQEDFFSELSEVHHHHNPRHHYLHLSCWQTIENAVLRSRSAEYLHDDDHSCWRTVKDGVRRIKRGDADHHQTCWQMVEDSLERVEKQPQHSCWQTVKDAVLRAEEAEEDHYYHPRCEYCWKTVEDAVLRAWIVARAFSLEYIIARSVLASSAAAIVTFQIVTTIVEGVRKGTRLQFRTNFDWLRFTATILQCVFILIGWFIIIWRWATAVAYYKKWKSDTGHSGFAMEDFWTRHLRELQQSKEPQLQQAQLLHSKIKTLVAKDEVTLTSPRKLLYVVILVNYIIVSFSKACWLASLMIFHNKLMKKFLSKILSKHEENVFEDYPRYEKILKGVQMLGETPRSLWLANRKSIAKAKNLILQGNQDGEYVAEHLVDFLATKKKLYGPGRRCLEPYKPQKELKYLCQKRPPPQQPDEDKQQSQEDKNGSLAVEEHFRDVCTKSWKMTAVSLLSIIVHLSPIYAEVDNEHCSASHSFPPKAVKDCLEAYAEAWEIIDFVEETDTEVDGITSQAADRYFDALQRKVKNEPLLASKFRDATPECVRRALEDLKKECKRETEPLGSVNIVSALFYALGVKDKKEKGGCQSNRWKRVGGNDSLDWKAAASGNAVYRLCNSIQCNDGDDVNELLKELGSSLADIINECLEKVQYLLLFNSKKWARNSDEKSMGKALYTVGKAEVIMDKLAKKHEIIMMDKIDIKGKTIMEERSDLAIVPIE